MIPHKNLFVGALGKLQNIGGSRIYTTPHTVSIPAEYTINVTMNIQGDLVGHSLDGRLWLYRRSRRLGIIALKWNARKAELEYAAGQNISGNDDVVLACGLDWVLTNNNIFMVVDDEPYILTTRLFDANIPDTFLYSLLRSGSIGASGIDSFTGEAWGKREDNGNSEGTGYFSKATHLLYPAGTHSFEQCYSLLPAIGDWQIFENFLVRRPDAESITSYNYMQAVRPLIPLEFNNGAAVYGTGYNYDHRGIQLFHCKGEIFSRGFRNIGKVSLLPAVFSEDGSVQEYYLYISPDFTRNDNSLQYSDWQNLVLAALGDNSLYGVMSEQPDTIASATCTKSTDGRVLIPKTGEFLTLSENNAHIFFDALTHKGLLLDDNGGQLMLKETISDTQDVSCKTLNQWLAPAGRVDAVTDDYITASADNAAFCTSLVTGFNRQYLSPNTIPLTVRAFQDSKEDFYRLAVSDGVNENNRKIFGVNKILSQNITQEAIPWQNIYKEAVKIELLNSFEIDSYHSFFSVESFYEKEKLDGSLSSILDLHHFDSISPIFLVGQTYTFASECSETLYGTDGISTIHIYIDSDIFEAYDNCNIESNVVALSVSAQFVFINPDTGQPSDIINTNASFSYGVSGSWVNPYGQRYSGISYKEMPLYPGIYDGKIGYIYSTIDFSNYYIDHHGVHYKETVRFKPMIDIPEQIRDWNRYGDCYYIWEKQFSTEFPLTSLNLKENFLGGYTIFTERFSDIYFLQHINLLEDFIYCNWLSVSQYPYIPDKQVNNGAMPTSKKNLHILSIRYGVFSSGEKNIILVFRSEVNPDIFDFYTELERSKPQ